MYYLSRSGYLHLILPLSRFKQISGDDSLAIYIFNSGVQNILFAKSVELNLVIFRAPIQMVSDNKPEKIIINQFDCESWEKNASAPKLKG